MPSWEKWLPTAASQSIVIPAWAAHAGGRRVAAAGKLVGGEEAQKIARREGAYELSDVLANQLRLEGVELSARGEFPALSPANWLRSAALDALPLEDWRARWRKEGIELTGILLAPAARARFIGFLEKMNARELNDPWDLLALADHFFRPDQHELAISRNH